MAKSVSRKPETTDIGAWRRRIDALDLELIRMLNERTHCAIEVGRIKRGRNLPIYDPAREEQIIRMMIEENTGPLDGQGVRRLFERIIDESRRIERLAAKPGACEHRPPGQGSDSEKGSNED